MQLYEKLSFLMNLTNTKNRTLAQEIHVDPSLISRLRTGKRGEPRNPSHTKAMSKFLPDNVRQNTSGRRWQK